MGIVAHLAYKALAKSGHATIATIAAVAAGVAVYAIAVILLKMLSKEELNYIPGGGKLKRIMYRA